MARPLVAAAKEQRFEVRSGIVSGLAGFRQQRLGDRGDVLLLLLAPRNASLLSPGRHVLPALERSPCTARQADVGR